MLIYYYTNIYIACSILFLCRCPIFPVNDDTRDYFTDTKITYLLLFLYK